MPHASGFVALRVRRLQGRDPEGVFTVGANEPSARSGARMPIDEPNLTSRRRDHQRPKAGRGLLWRPEARSSPIRDAVTPMRQYPNRSRQ